MAARTKIGRNDPCPCGSMKKYKKCCLRRERLDVPERIAPPAGPPPELIRQLQERDAAVREWTRRYGHVRPCISADFQGHKFLAAGSRLYWSNDGKPWIFVPDFLLAYIPGVFGKEWGDAELAKPEPERHPLVHWRVEAIRYMNAQPRQPDGSYVAPPSGPLAAYMAFAFNLFAIEDNSRLDDFLLERLKNKDQFQGARHEVFAEATCLRAGFSIEREDQGDRTRRHVEFTAKHKSTGQLISVEAKSRHRPGVLGRPGIPQPHEKLSIRFGGLLNDAIAKNPAHPLVVFVDTNLPFRAAERVLGRDLGPSEAHTVVHTATAKGWPTRGTIRPERGRVPVWKHPESISAITAPEFRKHNDPTRP